jgi:MinD-like ATPase involved in chromosome partitioning or flagellar assembly
MPEHDQINAELFSGARRADLYRESEGPEATSPDPAGKAEPDAPADQPEPGPAAAPTQESAAAPAPVTRPALSGRTSVATQAPSEALPAQWGWRARVRKSTAGLVKLAPDEEELAHRRAITTIRQATWTRSVNVLVTNPKGGTGKTPTSLILAGILGDVRGGYVVAWEAAESIGSLSARAEGDPARGLAELLDSVGEIRSAGNIGGYTAPQTSHADVIGSITERPILDAGDIVAVRKVLDTYYRITVTDTGNNPGHPAFLAALRTADAAVLPCLVSIDALTGVEQALAVITRDGTGGLASRVVVVLGHDGGPEDREIAVALRQRLEELGVAAVLEVPFDPAIRAGGEITLSALSEASKRAWTAVAAAVAQSLRTAPTSTDLVHELEAASHAATPVDQL